MSPPKPDLEKQKKGNLTNTSMAQVHDENHAKRNDLFSDGFWVKEPRHAETVSDEK